MTRGSLIVAALSVLAIVGWPDIARAESPGPPARSFSREGLDRVGDYIRNEISTGKIPGAIMLIQQHGKPVYFESFGVRDIATQLRMSRDTGLPRVLPWRIPDSSSTESLSIFMRPPRP